MSDRKRRRSCPHQPLSEVRMQETHTLALTLCRHYFGDHIPTYLGCSQRCLLLKLKILFGNVRCKHPCFEIHLKTPKGPPRVVLEGFSSWPKKSQEGVDCSLFNTCWSTAFNLVSQKLHCILWKTHGQLVMEGCPGTLISILPSEGLKSGERQVT